MTSSHIEGLKHTVIHTEELRYPKMCLLSSPFLFYAVDGGHSSCPTDHVSAGFTEADVFSLSLGDHLSPGGRQSSESKFES